ncbi:putative fatty acid repression mutant protein [Aspergillus fijiensis CBS 313.89]|uniref:Putative fatty acid repression mutant protein n=1 Tax=Aspergillus fijiensis CBS 313.89 TaxID=1448319 RepID=A0A8G1VYX4_9EURO|nr:putative fatty acid repression mutant protein [Aspergillus fijiensis CBS 313.89]RAK74449.1 putative fatty acid repression mutant protein [Aspergillus fijiensis CBS 313.89]
MHNLATAVSDGFRGRRTIYALSDESTISDERLEELINEVVLHTPSAFNSQATRLVVLLKDEHRKLWDLAAEVASSTVSPELFEKLYKPRIAMYRAGYGTVLFYEDPMPLKRLEEKWPMLRDKFPQWSEHSNGMHQFALWALLEAEGLGCNLQHYSPMLDAPITEHWNVPGSWSLKAQLVFGKPAGSPVEKTFEPLGQRVFIHG